MADLFVLPRSGERLQIDAGFGGKKIEQTGRVKNKRVISASLSEQLARTSERSLPNEKGHQSHHSK